MKLIIDIDEKLVCEGFERNFTEERNVLIRAIGNGTPYEERLQGERIGGMKCSVCGEFSNDTGNFCSNCSADMRGAENDNKV